MQSIHSAIHGAHPPNCRSEAPTIFYRGRRIPVGEARFVGDGWSWWRRVRKEQKGQRQAHWWHARSGWVIGCDLLSQVQLWATWTIYEDEEGGEWWIKTADIQGVGDRVGIQGAPHWFVAARHWDYKPPTKPSAVQIPLAI